MSNKLKNTSAFPWAMTGTGGETVNGDSGMTLRDYFAAASLPAIITATNSGKHRPAMRAGEDTILPAICRDSYELADAMLEARGE